MEMWRNPASYRELVSGLGTEETPVVGQVLAEGRGGEGRHCAGQGGSGRSSEERHAGEKWRVG